MIYVKSWSHWIQLNSEEMKKISQKTVVEAQGNSGGDGDQPLATMFVYSSLDESPDFFIPTRLQDEGGGAEHP